MGPTAIGNLNHTARALLVAVEVISAGRRRLPNLIQPARGGPCVTELHTTATGCLHHGPIIAETFSLRLLVFLNWAGARWMQIWRAGRWMQRIQLARRRADA